VKLNEYAELMSCTIDCTNNKVIETHDKNETQKKVTKNNKKKDEYKRG